MSVMISHWNRNINLSKKQLGENLTERHFFSFHFANNASQNMTKWIYLKVPDTMEPDKKVCNNEAGGNITDPGGHLTIPLSCLAFHT